MRYAQARKQFGQALIAFPRVAREARPGHRPRGRRAEPHALRGADQGSRTALRSRGGHGQATGDAGAWETADACRADPRWKRLRARSTRLAPARGRACPVDLRGDQRDPGAGRSRGGCSNGATGEPRPQIRHGRYLDDFVVGETFAHPWEVTVDDGMSGALRGFVPGRSPTYASRERAQALGFRDRPLSPLLLLNLGVLVLRARRQRAGHRSPGVPRRPVSPGRLRGGHASRVGRRWSRPSRRPTAPGASCACRASWPTSTMPSSASSGAGSSYRRDVSTNAFLPIQRVAHPSPGTTGRGYRRSSRGVAVQERPGGFARLPVRRTSTSATCSCTTSGAPWARASTCS